ncbi:MAG TPA: alpha/beta hydrolase-fold protein [Streptosporangiaceae bacterium]|nr:alpha/beta hydrolase-fold protein [Streptosporangiaceae bacterium]
MPAEPIPEVAETSPRVDESRVTFRLPDPGHRLAGVRLWQDVPIPGDRLDFHSDGDGWELVIDRPPVSRMEYLLELRYTGGGSETVLDPGNPRQVAGAFGPKSVLEFPSYTPPAWLTAPAGNGSLTGFDVPVKALDAAVAVRIWSPGGTNDSERLPLLVAHDGPEYDSLASLTRYLSAGVTGGWLPRLRAALLAPGHRDRWYSANMRYTRALCQTVLPAITGRVAASQRVGMGASLGALSMLHAHCRYPGAFDALFLQSGSFFCPAFDEHERRFAYYRRVVRFVADVHDGGLPPRPVPTVLSCGMIEENAENNRLMVKTLRSRGYPAILHEVPDMHNYTAWRDAFDPWLTELLGRVSP